MSVGHVARLAEEEGIPTVIVAAGAFRDRLEAMSVPRLLPTSHWMGRPLGPPGEARTQRETLSEALELLETVP